MRRRVRVVHPLHVQLVRADRARPTPTARPKVVDPRQRAEPDRPGHRVRLLLLPRRLRAARRGLRDGHDQLQPRDGVDRLRHGRPVVLRAADVRGRDGDHRDRAVRRAATSSCLVQFGGQTPLKLSLALQDAGVRILGTSPDSIDLAEDRKRFSALLQELDIPQPASGTATSREEARDVGGHHRLPGRRPAVVRPRRARHGHRVRRGDARPLHDARRRRLARAPDPRRQVPRGRVRVRRGRRGRRDRRRRHRRHHGAHRGGRHPLGRQLVRGAAVHLPRAPPRDDSRLHAPHRPRAEGDRADERAVRDQGRCGLRARGEPAGVAHGAVPVEGRRRVARQGGGQGDGGADARRPRAHTRPRGGRRVRQEPGVPVRPLPGRGHDSRARDEVDRRGDGRLVQLRRGLRQGAARRGPAVARGRHGLRQREQRRQAEPACRSRATSRELGFSTRRHARDGRVPARLRPRRRGGLQGERRPAEHRRRDRQRQDRPRRQHAARARVVLRRPRPCGARR